MKFQLLTVILTGVLLPLSTIASAQEPIPVKKVYNIAIIRDGDSEYFDNSVTATMQELKILAEGNYSIEVRDEYNASYKQKQVSEFLDQALADPSVDLIYAAGVIATELSARLPEEERNKPILGGALQFSNIRGHTISSEGTSRLSNYTFITSPRRVTADLTLLADLSESDKLYALIDELLLPELKELPEAKAEVESSIGQRISMLAASASATETLERLPKDLSALYVALMPRMDSRERERLYAGLAERGVLTVTMNGHIDVRLGALAGLASDTSQAVARRAALNIHQLLQGVNTDSLPVYLPVFDRLMLNAETAQAIDWSPNYDTALSADFYGSQIRYAGEPITLVQAMQTAAQNNIDVTISREDQAANEYDVAITRSQLRPNVSGKGSLGEVRTWDRINTLTTPEKAREQSLGLQLTQILFRDDVWSALKSQRKIAEASRFLTVSSELDAIDSASSAYFDYLTAKRLAEIERENLNLTESNFQLAKLRIEIGAAEPSESYRWEQSSARNRANLIQRESSRANALVAFNRQIGAPRETTWNFQDIELNNRELYFLDEQLRPLIDNTKDFQEFGRFLQAYSIDNAPELLAFDLQLAAQGVLLRQSKRRYMPEIAASLEYANVFQNSDFAPTDSQNEATLGISISFPVFEGGGRRAEILKNKAVIRGLAAQREKAVQQIEQRTLAAFYGISASHPNMRLSRVSLEAAEKNYESVQEKYSQGAASILDLLDAQQSLLSQKQAAATAIYDYLKDIHKLQRAIAWYEFEKTDEEKRKLTQQFTQFTRGGEDSRPTDPFRQEAYTEALETIQSSQP